MVDEGVCASPRAPGTWGARPCLPGDPGPLCLLSHNERGWYFSFEAGEHSMNETLLGLARVDQTQHIECRERVTATHAKIMQATGNLHHHIRNTSFGQTQDIFDDPAPLHAGNHVFYNNTDTGDPMIEERVPHAQLLASGLFLGCWGRTPAGS